MRYYLIGSEDGYNGLRFRNVADWQKYFGFNSYIAESWTAPDLEYIHRTTQRYRHMKNIGSRLAGLVVLCIVLSIVAFRLSFFLGLLKFTGK